MSTRFRAAGERCSSRFPAASFSEFGGILFYRGADKKITFDPQEKHEDRRPEPFEEVLSHVRKSFRIWVFYLHYCTFTGFKSKLLLKKQSVSASFGLEHEGLSYAPLIDRIELF